MSNPTGASEQPLANACGGVSASNKPLTKSHGGGCSILALQGVCLLTGQRGPCWLLVRQHVA